MTRATVEDKIAAWYTAFNAVKEELTPRAARGAGWGDSDIVARVAANDRTAALVAALLVGSAAARPILTDILEETP